MQARPLAVSNVAPVHSPKVREILFLNVKARVLKRAKDIDFS